jgi:hypothetical protein
MIKPDVKKANLIFDKWKAELKEMDRTRANVDNNFDILFSNLKNSKISFETAHEILSKATIAHYPTDSVIDFVYKKTKGFGKTKQEYSDEWKENISASAKRMFYSLYDIEGEVKEDKKEYGSMSAKEYRLQRKHAESFPLIDWEKIELKPMSEDDIKELENLVKNLGGKNE